MGVMLARSRPAIVLAFTLACSIQGAGVVALPLCSEDCQRGQRAALQRIYLETGGSSWRQSGGWQPSGDDDTINVQGTLPQHCSWAFVSCCAPDYRQYPLPGYNASATCTTAYGVASLVPFFNNMVRSKPAMVL